MFVRQWKKQFGVMKLNWLVINGNNMDSRIKRLNIAKKENLKTEKGT